MFTCLHVHVIVHRLPLLMLIQTCVAAATRIDSICLIYSNSKQKLASVVRAKPGKVSPATA